MTDHETIDVYGKQAGDYASMTVGADKNPQLIAFIGGLVTGARVLDLGCGPGQAAAEMARAGLVVDATDATPAMVDMAGAHEGVSARVATFDDISGAAIYDGIWANFCLLHAPRAEMPRHLAALHRAMKPGGLFHIGMKTGTGEKRDAIGRFYTYYSETELSGLLNDAGFVPFSSATGSDRGMDGVIADWVVIAANA